MRNPEEIITDAEIIRVHGYANFGDMTPREVVNEGVKKYAVGFTSGHTQMCILREHGLIRKPKPGSYSAVLTAKGKAYARSIWWTHFKTRTPTLADALALPEVAALVEALRRIQYAVSPEADPDTGELIECWMSGDEMQEIASAALAALTTATADGGKP